MKTRIIKQTFISFGLLLAISFYAISQKITIADGNFNDPAIWSPAGVPASSDDVIINRDVIINTAHIINSLLINNKENYTATVEMYAGAGLSVVRDVQLEMAPGILKEVEIIMADGALLDIGGNMNFIRENEGQDIGCRLFMTGGTTSVAGDLNYNYLTGGWTDGTIFFPEFITEIQLFGNSELSVSGTMNLIQDEATTLSTFQYILQVRTLDNAKLNVGSLVMQQDVDVSAYTPQIHVESLGASTITIAGDLTMNQMGAASNLLRFESEDISSFSILGNIIINKQLGRTILFELWNNSTGTVNGDISVTKSGGTSNIAIRARDQSNLIVNGPNGLTKTDSGGGSLFNLDVEANASMNFTNGSVAIYADNTTAGSTILEINGELSIGKDLIINALYRRFNINLTGTLLNPALLSVGGNFNLTFNPSNLSPSGVAFTNAKLIVGNDVNIYQNASSDSKELFLTFDGDIDGTIGGNFTWEDKRGISNFTLGGIVAGSAGTLQMGNLNLKHTAILSHSSSAMTTTLKQDAAIVVSGNSQLTIDTDFGLTTERNKLYLLDNSNLNVMGDFTISSKNQQNATLFLFNNSSLTLGGELLRPLNFGDISFNDQSYMTFNGNSPQVIPAQSLTGAGTDGIYFNRVVANNTSPTIPQLTLISDVNLNQLDFMSGIIKTSSTAKIIFREGGISTGSGNQRFIDGPVQKNGTTDFEFPIGDSNGTIDRWSPLSVSNITGGASTLTTTAEYFIGSVPNSDDIDPTLATISGIEYWDVSPSEGISAEVTLFWKDADFSEITDEEDLTFAHYNSTSSRWEDMFGAVGEGSVVGPGGGEGSITAYLSSFSPVSFGSKGGVNPLPVILTDFKAELKNNFAEISWITSSEIENDRFEIEKSMNGREFLKISEVKGHGSTSEENFYIIKDRPLNGVNYYRLKQIDFSGKYTYSKVVSVEKNDLLASTPVIYPNPVSSGIIGKITIDMNPEIAINGDPLSITLIGPTGNTIMRKEVVYSGNSINLDLDQDLNKGIHFVIVSNVLKRYQTKLLVE